MRVGIYYRVSSEEQIDGYSLDAQRRALLDFCQPKGWRVVEEYADEGKSARGDDIAKRPAFKRMLEDAEAGRLDLVVVHKLDRFSRNIRITFDSLARLDKCGVAFTTVMEHQFDFTTPMGKVMLSMLAAFAQYYSDNLSQETKKGKAERKAQGMYNGRIPWGMTKGPDGIPVEHPEMIAGLRLAFSLAAAGESDRDIARALNERGFRTNGYRTGKPEPFTRDTVCRMLQSRFYLGELPGERTHDAAPVRHAAVIDQATFDAAQAQRERRAGTRSLSVPQSATTYSLSGLGVCAHCGGKMHIQRSHGSIRLYCANKRQGLPCASKSGTLLRYDAQIGQHLRTFTIPHDWRTRLTEEYGQRGDDGEEVAAKRKATEGRLARLKDLFLLGDIARDAYMAERDRLQKEIADLSPRVAPAGNDLDDFVGLLGDIARTWQEATPAQRNQMARVLFEEVVINDERVTAVKPRPELAGFFALDRQHRDGTCKGAEVTGFAGASTHPALPTAPLPPSTAWPMHRHAPPFRRRNALASINRSGPLSPSAPDTNPHVVWRSYMASRTRRSRPSCDASRQRRTPPLRWQQTNTVARPVSSIAGLASS